MCQAFVVLHQPVLAREKEVLLLNCFHVKFHLFISLTDMWEAPRAPDIVTAALTEQLTAAQIVVGSAESDWVTHLGHSWNVAACAVPAEKQKFFREARPVSFQRSQRLWLMELFSSTPVRLREFKYFTGTSAFSACRNTQKVTVPICLESNRNKKHKRRRKKEESKWAKIRLEKWMSHCTLMCSVCAKKERLSG